MFKLEELPLRQITVIGPSLGPEKFEGHSVQTVGGAAGPLSILRYVNDSLFTVKTFAVGAWSTVELNIPTAADIALIDTIFAEHAARQKAQRAEDDDPEATEFLRRIKSPSKLSN
jgi:hypothetical protein